MNNRCSVAADVDAEKEEGVEGVEEEEEVVVVVLLLVLVVTVVDDVDVAGVAVVAVGAAAVDVGGLVASLPRKNPSHQRRPSTPS